MEREYPECVSARKVMLGWPKVMPGWPRGLKICVPLLMLICAIAESYLLGQVLGASPIPKAWLVKIPVDDSKRRIIEARIAADPLGLLPPLSVSMPIGINVLAAHDYPCDIYGRTELHS